MEPRRHDDPHAEELEERLASLEMEEQEAQRREEKEKRTDEISHLQYLHQRNGNGNGRPAKSGDFEKYI